jgi:hypothetical protein
LLSQQLSSTGGLTASKHVATRSSHDHEEKYIIDSIKRLTDRVRRLKLKTPYTDTRALPEEL